MVEKTKELKETTKATAKQTAETTVKQTAEPTEFTKVEEATRAKEIQKTEEYNAESIKLLEDADAVRKRPGMYIGSTGESGLYHLIVEIVDNAIDEGLGGFCSDINVTLFQDDSVCIEDNGRGIPTSINFLGKSALELATTKLHAGGKFDQKSYKISGGLHGVGLSVVNALSDLMVADVFRDGFHWQQTYSRGLPTSLVKKLEPSEKHGTKITFKPDFSIFSIEDKGKTLTYNGEKITEILREKAYLNSCVKIVFADKKSNKTAVFENKGGLVEYLKDITKNKTFIIEKPFFLKSQTEKIFVDIAFTYTTGYGDNILSYVNNIRTSEGGTHVTGFLMGLGRAISKYFKAKQTKGFDAVETEDIRAGLVAIISVNFAEPQFEGQTKAKMGVPWVRGEVDKIINDAVYTFLDENPEISKRLFAKLKQTADGRIAAEKAKDLVRRKGELDIISGLPGKLADCSERDPEKTELFIVEGDSAGGSSKMGRDRKTQAVLPLRGKILNVEKAGLERMLNSEVITPIIAALGTNIDDKFDINKLRYGKIIIMADADVDGSHIQTLLLTLFFRHFKPLIEQGHIYSAVPPLYKVYKGNKEAYAYSDEERDKLLQEIGSDANVQRYKGLGEMNPDQLGETTLNRDTRTLKRIIIEDAERADKLFTILMGSDVEPRKKFIEQYAREVKNIDA